jgi:lactobin A/cerein 7B family class IIb bacteriocin
MLELNKEEKLQVNGGAVNWGLVSLLGGLSSFIIGLIDGLMKLK